MRSTKSLKVKIFIVTILLSLLSPKSFGSEEYSKIAENAHQEINSILSNTNILENQNIKYTISDKIDKEIIASYKNNINRINTLFDKYISVRGVEILFWTDQDMEWANSQHQIITRNQVTPIRQSLFNCNSAYADRVVGGINILVMCAHPNYLTQTDKRLIAPHEFAHIFQMQSTMNIPQTPCWIKEGMANYYGLTVADELKNINDFYKVFTTYFTVKTLENKKIIDIMKQDPVKLMKLMEDPSCGRFSNDNYVHAAYSLGAIMFEWLVSKHGHDAVGQFLLRFKSNPSWQENFNVAFGSTVEKFYSDISPYVVWRANELLNPTVKVKEVSNIKIISIEKTIKINKKQCKKKNKNNKCLVKR